MRTKLFSLFLVFMMVPAISMAGNEFTGKHTKQKKIKKEFTVSANDLLKIENSYGNVDLTTWDQNRVVIEVVVTTSGNDEKEVMDRLKEIDVDFYQGNNMVRAVTEIEENSGSWWNKLFDFNSGVSMEINYRVKAPVKNPVDLSNDYGSISVDKLTGNAEISCDYGRLMIGDLLGDKNVLSFDYTQNSNIHYIKNGHIRADYSEFTIEEAGSLDIAADYTEGHIVKVEHLVFNNDYGSIQVDRIRDLEGRGDYLGVKLGQLYRSAEIAMDYGSLSILKLMPGLKTLQISSDYTGIRLGYDPEAAFNFEISTSYGNVDGFDEGFTLNKKHESGGDHFYSGYHLSDKTGANIAIETSYGNITLNEK